MSVRKAHDPYLDVPWDDPAYQLDPDDPRLRLAAGEPLAQTRWYANLDAHTQTRFGAEWTAQSLKYAIGFEAVLSRGLLAWAQQAPNQTPDYRYVMHEVVEEARHSMMFQEVIDRLRSNPRPMTGIGRWVDDRIAVRSRDFPELFFFGVLGGEIFIDQQNREMLRRPSAEVHPLLRRVMQIHVTEEARHVCFAEHFLKERLPQLGPKKRAVLRAVVPLVLFDPARMLLTPPAALVKRYAIPREALRQAFGPGSQFRQTLARTAEPVRRLCETHDLLWPAPWRAMGLLG